jgi:hypothetical protein
MGSHRVDVAMHEECSDLYVRQLYRYEKTAQNKRLPLKKRHHHAMPFKKRIMIIVIRRRVD